MIDITNHTPFLCDYLPHARRGKGAFVTVIVKGTFTMAPGQVAPVAEDQLPIAVSDAYTTEQDTPLLHTESDLVPFKPRADVALIGTAYAPNRRPVSTLLTRLRVGRLEKSVAIVGDRYWDCPSKWSTPAMTQPVPFTSMALTYDRAYGGVDTGSGTPHPENPTGRGFALSDTRLHMKRLPNLEDPNQLIRTWKDRPHPAGYGFVEKHARGRLQYAGTSGQLETENRILLPPPGFRDDFYNGAQRNLQVPGYLRGDEEVELQHLTPNGYVRFRLPGVRPRVTVHRPREADAGGDGMASAPAVHETPVDTVLDTLVFLPDEGVFYQVWRGSFPAEDAGEAAAIVVRTEAPWHRTQGSVRGDEAGYRAASSGFPQAW